MALQSLGSASLVIRPAGAPRLISGTTTASLITFYNTSNVLIDGSIAGTTAGNVLGGDDSLRQLTITNLSTNPAPNMSLVRFAGDSGIPCSNNTIKNTRLVGPGPQFILTGVTFGFGGEFQDNSRIENCSFRRLAGGAHHVGRNTVVITKNDLTGQGAERVGLLGLLTTRTNGVEISLNTVGGLDTNTSVSSVAIGAGAESPSVPTSFDPVRGAVITRNIVTGVKNAGGGGALGLGLASAAGTASVISNNFISGVVGSATAFGRIDAALYCNAASGTTVQIFHNTARIAGDRGATAGQSRSYALALLGSATMEIRNNIFANFQTSSGGVDALSAAIGTNGATTSYTLNPNLYYATGPQAAPFRTGGLLSGGTDYATLAAWRTATSQDADSIFADPLVVSDADLHLTLPSPANNIGQPVPVSLDIDGETRNAAQPDLGADEFFASARLANLTISSGTLTPVFASSTITYSVSLANAVNSVTVTPTAQDPAAAIDVRVNGGSFAAVPSGSPSASLPLNVGPNPIDVRVTAAGGTPILTYTVTATRLDNLVAGTLNLSTSQGYARVVTQAEFAAAATFTAGYSPTILSAGPTSAQGGAITFSAGVSSTYGVPAPSFTGADSFSYTLQNSLGQTASGAVNVTVTAPAYPPRPTTLSYLGGAFGGSFAVGVPGLQYRIDYSDDLLVAFAPLMVSGNPVIVTANGSGGFSFSDPGATIRRFYRAVPLP